MKPYRVVGSGRHSSPALWRGRISLYKAEAFPYNSWSRAAKFLRNGHQKKRSSGVSSNLSIFCQEKEEAVYWHGFASWRSSISLGKFRLVRSVVEDEKGTHICTTEGSQVQTQIQFHFQVSIYVRLFTVHIHYWFMWFYYYHSVGWNLFFIWEPEKD